MKMVSLLSSLGFALVASIAIPASAARTGVNLTIGDITVYGSNARIAISGGTLSGTKASCTPSSRQNHFGINLATEKGRAQLSLATAAMLSGKVIFVTGKDTCIAVDVPGTSDWQELDQISLVN